MYMSPNWYSGLCGNSAAPFSLASVLGESGIFSCCGAVRVEWHLSRVCGHRVSPAELGRAGTTSFPQKKVIYRSGSGVSASLEAVRDASVDFEAHDLNGG